MEVEELIGHVRSVLSEGPATFDEVLREVKRRTETDNRAGFDAPGGIGIALGALEARGEVGYAEDARFVLEEDAVGKPRAPMSYEPVLNALWNEGPATFDELMDRLTVKQVSDVGFALGWLYGEGNAAPKEGPGRPMRWCLDPKFAHELSK